MPRHPVHTTLRVERAVGNLREKRRFQIVRGVLRELTAREGFRVIHFSVQGNHMHLLVEAADTARLSRGVQSLEVRIALGLNRLLGRHGRVFADRYHARSLKTPREVRNALAYVLLNSSKHMGRSAERVDPCSSAAYFDGWRVEPDGLPSALDPEGPPVRRARTWLLTVGWRRHRLLDPRERPGAS